MKTMRDHCMTPVHNHWIPQRLARSQSITEPSNPLHTLKSRSLYIILFPISLSHPFALSNPFSKPW